MVKDNIVFADVHASFDDDFSDVYLTQSDYDLVATATRKSVRPTQAAFDRHIGAVETSAPARPAVSESRVTVETNPLSTRTVQPESATDSELVEALSTYESLNHHQESTNKLLPGERRDTRAQRERKSRRRRGQPFYNTHHSNSRGPVKCRGNCTYPIGHPMIIHGDFKDPRSYFGFISATVNPPRGLYFPVLPFKTAKGKLVFTLCRTCAECNNQQTACTHSDEQRSLTGVWTTPEFVKALDLGYTVAEITEVWHYTRTSDTIFRDYMRAFLKGKQESSGYPAHVVNQADRERYIEGYAIHQGIQLDPSKIAVNPGKRQVSKLCLNNLWGKLAQRDNMTNTKIVTKSEDFF
nr:uncharacterized protein LOC125971340 isoform X2 [Syngnathus scovelli]